MVAMDSVEYEDLSERVYKTLKEMILKSELKPGEKLIQEELSERLGVSRTPLLTAFSKLEKEMLVDLVPRRGAFVRKCTVPELFHFYDIRLRLEPLGAREAAIAARKDNTSELEEALSRYRNLVSRDDREGIKEADYLFHMEVMRLSGNPVLIQIVSSFNIVLISNQRGLLKPPARSLQEHDALFAAIVGNDGDAAERIMHDHLADARSQLARLAEAGRAAAD